jgi:dihydroxy-acid dehydratase
VIEIDLTSRTLNVRLSHEEIQDRLAELSPFESQSESAWLRRYARMVTSASRGAILL